MASQRQIGFFRGLYQERFKKSFGQSDDFLSALIDDFGVGTNQEEILEEMNSQDRD